MGIELGLRLGLGVWLGIRHFSVKKKDVWPPWMIAHPKNTFLDFGTFDSIQADIFVGTNLVEERSLSGGPFLRVCVVETPPVRKKTTSDHQADLEGWGSFT